jgi:hypothetical protein
MENYGNYTSRTCCFQGHLPLLGLGPLPSQWQHPFLKNASNPIGSARTETSAERIFQEQLVAKQESSTNLIKRVDELKRKTEKTEREFEEFKRQQQEEYNKLREDIMRFSSSSGNS